MKKMEKKDDFKGKVAVITGASRGIGKAVSIRLAQMGVNICAIARNQKELDDLHEEIVKHGVECFTGAVSVSDYDGLGAVIDNAFKKYKRIDILVNSAGTGVASPFEELTLKEIDETIDVNLKGLIYATKHVVTHMSSTGGNIINVSSMSGTRGIPHPVNNNGIYTASKFGVNGFSECMEKYLLKYNIRVTTLCPGSTDTSWWDRWKHSFGTDQMIPADYVADVVEFILGTPENVLFKQLRFLPTVEADNF